MVDLFFYREPEEAKGREEEEGVAPEYTATEFVAPPLTLPAEQWVRDAGDAGNWEPDAVAPVTAAVSVPEWTAGPVPMAAGGWDPAPAPTAPAGAGWDPAVPPQNDWEPSNTGWEAAPQ